jgi:hypothetical protein
VKSALANLDLVRGIKAHAEIGGFARWGIRVLEMAAEIGKRTDLPVYVHFGQLWGLPESGTNGEDVDTILETDNESAPTTRDYYRTSQRMHIKRDAMLAWSEALQRAVERLGGKMPAPRETARPSKVKPARAA